MHDILHDVFTKQSSQPVGKYMREEDRTCCEATMMFLVGQFSLGFAAQRH